MQIFQLILKTVISFLNSLTVKKQAELTLAQTTEVAVVNTIVANTNIKQNEQLIKTQNMLEEVQEKHKQEIEDEKNSNNSINPLEQSW